MHSQRDQGLLSWQWSLYPPGHRDRRNLLVHALTAPLFVAGTLALAAAPWLGGAGAIAGAVAVVLTVAAQGRGHRVEPTRPEPFLGALDVVARLFVEQWVTFPRFVVSGRFAAAWRAARL